MYTALIIGILVALTFSAFFSGMEIAFVASNRMLAEMGKDKNNPVQRITNYFFRHANDFVSTMLVGNNIALVIYGILIANYFDNTIFRGFDPSFTVPADTLLSTIIVLFTGEFLPKVLFKSAPNRWLSLFAIPAFLCYVLLWPISRFATMISHAILCLVGVKVKKVDEEGEFSKVDLDYLVQASIDSTDNKDIEPEMELFQNALDFSETRVRDCMIPRTEVQAVDIADCTLDNLKQKFIESGHSKLIVYKDDIDHIVGYIHSSEMFSDAENWRDRIISMPFVPESMAAQKLMQLFMQQKKSLGVVVDEFGGTGGIVALEDIVEEIFGEIEDEHDSSNLVSQQVGENEYLLSARMEIDNVNEMFGIGLPEDDDYMTIGGLILHYNQSFPQINEVIRINQFEFKILKKTNTKIELVKLKVVE
jgi:putative hemolysin